MSRLPGQRSRSKIFVQYMCIELKNLYTNCENCTSNGWLVINFTSGVGAVVDARVDVDK